jgi:hypothetical protein
MGLNGQRHAPAALYPQGKDPRYPLDRRLDGPQNWSGQRLQEKSFAYNGNQTPIVQSVIRHYIDWVSSNPIQFLYLSVRKQQTAYDK